MKNTEKAATYTLCGDDIDRIGEEISRFFETHGEERKNALRLSYAAQEALLNMQARFGEKQEVKLTQTTRFGMARFEISVRGEPFDPLSDSPEDTLMRALLNRLELAPVYAYRNGCNHIVFTRQKKKKLSSTAQLLLAMAGGAALGEGFYCLAPKTGEFLAEDIFAPIFSSLMSLIATLAAALIFISVINSIYGIGDFTTLRKIGKTMLLNFLKWLTICGLVTAGVMTLVYPPNFSTGAGADLTQVYKLFIDIVPTNLLNPLLTGNTLQLLMLAIIFGIGMLALGEKMDGFSKGFQNMELLTQKVTMGVLNLLPIIVFVSIFRIFVMNQLGMVLSVIQVPVFTAIISTIILIGYVLRISVFSGVNPMKIMKKVMPTIIQGFITASSSATLFLNEETCEKRLGIDKTLVNFGVPLGQVIYMPSVVCGFSALAFCVARMYGVEITPMWIIIEILMVVLVSIALPPIPGAGALGYTILFAQLGIPLEGMAIALALDTVLDHWDTGMNLGMLQLELVRVAKKLGKLDDNTLHN